MEKKCFIAGLPKAGKTTYIAALWDIIQRRQGDFDLQFATNPENATYLNEIWEYWVKMENIERSKTPAPDDIKINVRRKSDGQEMELCIPDFMGEQFQKIIDRTLSENIKKWIESSDRMLYLINTLEDGSKDDMDDEEEEANPEGADRQEEREKALPLTPERMMDVSQNLMVLKYIVTHTNLKKIAIGISAWDKKMGAGQTPEEYLKRRSPVMYNFIKYHFEDVLYFGVSAQGFDYSNKAEKATEMREKARQSNRAFIAYATEETLSSDLTRPLNYLIS